MDERLRKRVKLLAQKIADDMVHDGINLRDILTKKEDIGKYISQYYDELSDTVGKRMPETNEKEVLDVVYMYVQRFLKVKEKVVKTWI